jgi:hypothetical protein
MDQITDEQLDLVTRLSTDKGSVMVGTQWLVDLANEESKSLRTLIQMGLMVSVQDQGNGISCLVMDDRASIMFDSSNQSSTSVN